MTTSVKEVELPFDRFNHYKYKFEMGPREVRAQEIDSVSDDERSINCQAFIHVSFKCIGVSLPEDMLSKEIYEDEELFETVTEDEVRRNGLRIFDVVCFGEEDLKDFIGIHLGICTGEVDDNGDYIIAHANKLENGVSKWPLRRFNEEPKYKSLYAVKRYKNLPEDLVYRVA